MMPMQHFKPSKLLGECRLPLNKSESKYFVVGHEPHVEPTNTFEITSSEVKFVTVARIIDRKTNLYIDMKYADIIKMRDSLSMFIDPSQEQQQQQPQPYKFPIYLDSIQVAKIMQDLFCIASRSSAQTMLIGRTTIEQLVLLSTQLAQLFKQIDVVSDTLTRQANTIMIKILEKSSFRTYESMEDMCGIIEELSLEPCLLHTELFLKYPDIYFDILSNIKRIE